MKTPIIVGAVIVGIIGGVLLTPVAAGNTVPIAELAVIVSLLGLVLAFFATKGTQPGAAVEQKSVEASAPVPAPAVPAFPLPENQAESEIVAFLALLQEKGRLVDFLMEEVTGYEDAEVGAAARVVHQGCRQVLQEYFKISPIANSQEGSQITLPAGYSTDQYRVVGKLAGDPPFTGTLLHKGWKTESVKLPRIVSTDRLPAIAAAEVELK